MQEAVLYSKGQFLVVGKGSNSIFPDQGISKLVIVNKIDFYEENQTLIHVGAGFSFAILGARVSRRGLGGLEFASGIPGTVGGAIYMNAGANGHEVKDTLSEVEWIDQGGTLQVFKKDALKFSYRHSMFHDMQGVIVGATFELAKDLSAKEKQAKIIRYRLETQPYKEPSCGCIFRNPDGGHAGKLIEEAGLKGLTVGDAKVSDLHANFIVNKGKATAEDVRKLAELVAERVKKKTGFEIEREVRFVDEPKT
ncbi:MAG: UDP-N-acetylenolpyruvoylglucosamine reductase [Chlamydiia bacterium]|nr:UDP-N-acetylenolpyruvoylglucosamine reductase [Chlamydiia bacterium]MCH9615439.1 UDP-N-acetylenolpyruvoylglucosamine reductase [Chlamydiia bacterium]MCH9628239.1 UDP-N-acetylenolpyruvoylglucosamine reductase [Chlamydiia bacterium]